MKHFKSGLRVICASILILQTASFPQNGQKKVQQGLNLTVSSFRVEDYGPSAGAPSAPSLVGRMDATQSDDPRPKDPKVKPKCAKPGATYCTRSENYPTTYINDLIGKGVIKFNGFQDAVEDFNLTNRVDATNEIPLCASREHLVLPTEGETESGDWFFILNTDQIKQGVRVEECLKVGKECNLISGLETHCEQKYIFRQMIGLNGAGAEEMKFKIPSCCMCTVGNRIKRRLPPLAKRTSRQVAVKKTTTADTSDLVIFPQSAPSFGTRGSFTAESSCAKGSSYCINSANYPKQYIKMLVKMNALKNLAIFQDEDEPTVSLAERFSDNSGSSLCDYTATTVYPEAAKTKDKNWEWIVQFGEEESYKQAVKLELCKKEGTECNHKDAFSGGYVTSCKQKFVYRQLLAIGETGEPKLSHFQLPSCCACHVRASTSIAARFGVPDPAPKTPAQTRRRK